MTADGTSGTDGPGLACRAASLDGIVFAHAHRLVRAPDRAEAIAELIGLARGSGAVLATARRQWDALWSAAPDDLSAALAADLLHEAVRALACRRLGQLLDQAARDAESSRAIAILTRN
ncbi:MAG: hypothetical protein JWO37_3249 [Acidimicrobiales bacterium]|jgi:hypothetical protein|nr:hypothetical protein [Acidimicrobiales bacterium]